MKAFIASFSQLVVVASVSEAIQLSFVMAGLDPAIHLLRKRLFAKNMDTRVKPAYDAFAPDCFVARAPRNDR
jgi:hypothetical protein